MPEKRILILGAGLAGLSASWHLQKKGIDCQIFEKESEAGGLCRSKKINNFIFDYSGHLLHFRHNYTFNLVKSLLGNNLLKHQRSAWVYSYGKYTRYPFQANLYGLPSQIIKDCLIGFIKASRNGHPRNPANFLDWINSTFGKGISRHFMIPYNRKFWTVPPEELTCEWLDGFVPVPSLNQIIEGTVEESQRQFGYNAQFWYPKKGGINQLILALASQIKNIRTNAEITEIDLNKKVVKIAPGMKERFDYLISTIPLPDMPRLINHLPSAIQSAFRKLRWNSIFNLNLGIGKKDSSGRHWVYFPAKETSFFRVGFFNNFSASIVSSNESSLYAEVAYSQDKPIDKSTIASHIKEDLKKAGILNQKEKISAQDINDIKYGYPVYDSNYRLAKEAIIKFFKQKNILPCGRYGSWRYLSMEDVILDGKEAARLISENV